MKKNLIEGFTLPDVKTYHEAIENKKMGYWDRIR